MKKITAFTLAEVLIVAVVMGIIASITLPNFIKNHRDKMYNTARLKALKTFGEAGKMASINDEMNTQANAIDFVNNVLSKYLKITKVCAIANSTDCGFPSEIQPSDPSVVPKKQVKDLAKWTQLGKVGYTSVSSPRSDSLMSVIVSTTDGFSALIHYNPKCGRNSHEITYQERCNSKECMHYSIDAACMNVIYDMNGVKSPNHIGEDIGIVTIFWSGVNVTAVAPGIIPYSINSTGTTTAKFNDAPLVCMQKGTNLVSYTMPNIDELSSLYMNSELTSMPYGYYWSASLVSPTSAWRVYVDGPRYFESLTSDARIWCVRR